MAAETRGRVMVIWCPDWPVVAAMEAENLPVDTPVAVLHKGEVFACSRSARAEGVRRGMRPRDAASRCPELLLITYNPDLDVRAYEAVLTTVEEFSPGVESIRPGLCALRVPSRYYGGEPQAAALIAEQLVGLGVWDCRVGIADGMFAAEQAARLAPPQDCLVIEAGGSAEFLSGLSVGVLEDLDMVSLLRRMGIKTLGDFARLRSRDVVTRFGSAGAWAHRLASGRDARSAVGRKPPPELQQQVDFAPPLETIEPIAFSLRRTAERFVAELASHGLVCTTVRIDVSTEGSWHGMRRWSHPRWFTAADLVDRLRWQLQAEPATEPVSAVLLVPEVTESLADRGEGLWGSAPDERIERGVARVQSMLGHEGVVAASLQGGRNPRDRQAAAPWGEQLPGSRMRGLPYPGSLPPPAPARVFPQPYAATVVNAAGQSVAITSRGTITGEPVRFRARESDPFQLVDSWAGPWPIDELWWDEGNARRIARFQVVGTDGSAWLLVVENDYWWTEARYE